MPSAQTGEASQWTQWLDVAAAASQLILVILAAVAAWAAFRQVSTSKLLELTKFLQDPVFRDARRTVLTEISKMNGDWWSDPELEKAASTCAGHYDIVANILQFGASGRLKRHFAKHWGVSIISTYDILATFIERRRGAGGNPYHSYQWLYRAALRHHPKAVTIWPPKAEKDFRAT